jgi:hypothetical protein
VSLAVVGVVMNLIGLMAFLPGRITGTLSPFVAMLLLCLAAAFWTLSLAGLVVARSGRMKAGGVMVAIGSAFFIPLGIIGVIGARRIILADHRSLDARRCIVSRQSALPVLAFRSPGSANVIIALGFVGAVVAYFLAETYGPAGKGAIATPSVLLLVIGFFKRSSTYLKFDADHFELRLAPAFGWHAILYSEVTRCEIHGKRAIVFYRRHDRPVDAAPKRLKINLRGLKKEDLAPCIDAFQTRLKV